MSDDADYDDLVQENIDTVKKRVEQGDLDPEAVLAAERASKNRVTLVEWLEEQVADRAAQDAAEVLGGEETADEVEPYTGSSGGLFGKLRRTLSSRFFITGFVLGALVIGAAASLGGLPGATGNAAAVSPGAAGQQLDAYFASNGDALGNTSVTVAEVQQMENTDLYQASLEISIPGQNQTVPQTAFMTEDARFVFLGQPIDTSQPLAAQLGGQQAPQ